MSPVMGSLPTVARNRPSAPASSPLTMLPRETAAMQVSARQIRAKVSTGPKLSATAASCGAASTSTTMENSPPAREDSVAQPSA